MRQRHRVEAPQEVVEAPSLASVEKGVARRWLLRSNAWLGVALIVVALLTVFPLFAPEFHIEFATEILIFALFAMSLDLVWGYGGVISLGHAAFFGWGAYTAGYLATQFQFTSGVVTLPLAAAAGGMLSLVLGLFLFAGRRRLPIIYVAMSTFVLSYASERLADNWSTIGAANGIPSVPVLTWALGSTGGQEMPPGVSMYYFVLALLVAVFLVLRGLVHSQFGLVLAGSKGNDQRVTFLGYDLMRFRIVVFVISGTLAGLAGGLYSFENGFVSPSLTGYALSTEVALWLLLGGSGTLFGGAIGVLIFQYASLELANRYPVVWEMIVGALLVVVIMFAPNGLYGLVVPERFRRLAFVRANPVQSSADLISADRAVR